MNVAFGLLSKKQACLTALVVSAVSNSKSHSFAFGSYHVLLCSNVSKSIECVWG
jgi:hypothetical protein